MAREPCHHACQFQIMILHSSWASSHCCSCSSYTTKNPCFSSSIHFSAYLRVTTDNMSHPEGHSTLAACKMESGKHSLFPDSCSSRDQSVIVSVIAYYYHGSNGRTSNLKAQLLIFTQGRDKRSKRFATWIASHIPCCQPRRISVVHNP